MFEFAFKLTNWMYMAGFILLFLFPIKIKDPSIDLWMAPDFFTFKWQVQHCSFDKSHLNSGDNKGMGVIEMGTISSKWIQFGDYVSYSSSRMVCVIIGNKAQCVFMTIMEHGPECDGVNHWQQWCFMTEANKMFHQERILSGKRLDESRTQWETSDQ